MTQRAMNNIYVGFESVMARGYYIAKSIQHRQKRKKKSCLGLLLLHNFAHGQSQGDTNKTKQNPKQKSPRKKLKATNKTKKAKKKLLTPHRKPQTNEKKKQ